MKRLLIGLLSISMLQPALGMERKPQTKKQSAKKKKKKDQRKKKAALAKKTSPSVSQNPQQKDKVDKTVNFIKAIIEGDIHGVAKYIREKGDLNFTFPDGMTPLRFATKYNQPGIYDLLVVGGAIEEEGAVESYENIFEIMRLGGASEEQLEGMRQRQRERDGISTYTTVEQFFKAIETGNERVVYKYIREKGALNVKRADGLSPLSVADMCEQFSIYELLFLAGAADETVEANKAKETHKDNSNN